MMHHRNPDVTSGLHLWRSWVLHRLCLFLLWLGLLLAEGALIMGLWWMGLLLAAGSMALYDLLVHRLIGGR